MPWRSPRQGVARRRLRVRGPIGRADAGVVGDVVERRLETVPREQFAPGGDQPFAAVANLVERGIDFMIVESGDRITSSIRLWESHPFALPLSASDRPDIPSPARRGWVLRAFRRRPGARRCSSSPPGTSRCARRRTSKKANPTMTDAPTVLFVCVHNAGRSQMAAGYLQRTGCSTTPQASTSTA